MESGTTSLTGMTSQEEQQTKLLSGIVSGKHPSSTLHTNQINHLWFELSCLLLPLASIALQICTVFLDGKSINEYAWGRQILVATPIAATVWPIIFAAVVGSAVKNVARLRSEKGTSLGELETLMGSQTVMGTVRTATMLRLAGMISTALIIIWSFSPLGSQAVLRCFTIRELKAHDHPSISYMNDTAGTSMLGSGSGWARSTPILRSVLNTVMFSGSTALQYVDNNDTDAIRIMEQLGSTADVFRGSSVDAWRNIKIPRLERLPNYDPDSPSSWVEVPYSRQVVDYSSLIGVPVRETIGKTQGAIRSLGNLTFEMEAEYVNLQCDNWSVFSHENGDWKRWEAANKAKLVHGASLKENETMFLTFSGFFADLWSDSLAPEAQVPHSLVFGIRYWGTNSATSVINCNMSTTYVTVNATCESKQSSRIPCVVQKMRSNQSHQNQQFHTPFQASSVAELNLFARLPGIVISGTGSAMRTSIENFLQYPPNTTVGFNDWDHFDISKISINTFQDRLATILNTVWRSCLEPKVVVGLALETKLQRQTQASREYSLGWVYSIDPSWSTIFLVCNIVLLAATLVALIFRLQCLGPEILGFVSSIWRDSRYVDSHLQFDSSLDGNSKSRSLGLFKVRLGDAKGAHEETGRIVLGLKSGTSSLRRHRIYD